MAAFRRFLSDDSAATAIEYSILACGVALVIIAAVQGIGQSTNSSLQQVQTGLR